MQNRWYERTVRNVLRDLRATTDKASAEEQLPKVQQLLDKLAKSNIIHKNKVANLKSSVAKHVNSLK